MALIYDEGFTTSRAFWADVRALLPITLGVIPFGLISGIVAIGAGLSAPEALGMAVLVFAGSSQLVALQLLAATAPWLLIVGTTLIVNFRFTMYSASLATYFRTLPRRWRWLLAYLLTDQAYAVSITRFSDQPDMPHKHWFHLGGSLTMWLTWQLATLVGIFVGAQIPASWGLSFAVPLTFLALAVPAIRSRASVVTATVAVLVAVATAFLPYKIGLLAAAALGIAAGVLALRRR